VFECGDPVWEGAGQRVVLSARQGGRITSWRMATEERVAEPIRLEGGPLRVLFAEENYSGSSYCTAHPVRLKQSWFEGGHCAGMTAGHAIEWFRERLLP